METRRCQGSSQSFRVINCWFSRSTILLMVKQKISLGFRVLFLLPPTAFHNHYYARVVFNLCVFSSTCVLRSKRFVIIAYHFHFILNFTLPPQRYNKDITSISIRDRFLPCPQSQYKLLYFLWIGLQACSFHLLRMYF